MLPIEVVYFPLGKKTVQVFCDFEAGLTVADILHKTGLLHIYPEVAELKIGIFSKPVTREHVVKPGDRIEIYRSLIQDPKDKRRHRAKGKSG